MVFVDLLRTAVLGGRGHVLLGADRPKSRLVLYGIGVVAGGVEDVARVSLCKAILGIGLFSPPTRVVSRGVVALKEPWVRVSTSFVAGRAPRKTARLVNGCLLDH